MTESATMLEVLRRAEAVLERVGVICMERGFWVQRIDRPQGHPQGSKDKPVRFLDQHGAELARCWLEQSTDVTTGETFCAIRTELSERVQQALAEPKPEAN